MIKVNNETYYTLQEATDLCKEYVATHPGTILFNHAAHKGARRDTTEAERELDRRTWGGSSCCLQVTVFAADKVYADEAILREHPELKKMWRVRATGK